MKNLFIKEFKKTIKELDIESRAYTEFWNTFNQYRLEEPSEYKTFFPDYNESKMYIEIRSISLELDNWPETNDLITVRIAVDYDNIHTSNFIVQYKLNGKIYNIYFYMI